MKNEFDRETLTLENARTACERFIKTILDYPDAYRGRGIVICCDLRNFTNAWVSINLLRHWGCDLPIQVWHLESGEIDGKMKAILATQGVGCVDASAVLRKHPARIAWGWELRLYAVVHCSFKEVLSLDPGASAVVNPEFLFETTQYRTSGALFWPGSQCPPKSAQPAWGACGLRRPKEQEFECSQIVVDKQRCWRALQLGLWFNENSDFYRLHVPGTSGTLHLAFRKLRKSYTLIDKPILLLEGTACQHGFDGARVFQNRGVFKWSLLHNKRVQGFRLEKRCGQLVAQLRQIWDGRMGSVKGLNRPRTSNVRMPTIRAVMISCPQRADRRRQTLRNLSRTDWGKESVQVVIDNHPSDDPRERQTDTALRALQWGLESNADYLLFLEDDLRFNRHLRHNLEHWQPLRNRAITLAGLYNPHLSESAFYVRGQALIIPPDRIFGSQAFLLSRATVDYAVRNWNRMVGMQDIRLSRLAGRLKKPLYYHCPSLIQHVGTRSVWGGGYHYAPDFDRNWKAARLEASP